GPATNAVYKAGSGDQVLMVSPNAAPPPSETSSTGSAAVEFTSVPSVGSFDHLGGVIHGVNPADYKVAVFINVAGGWWNKPSWDSPAVSIHPDGSFVVA